ncbi:hypothetical protein [Smaragdicoccus niigatensis]|uniref:hypothetical protein n=1 Tax=Smaragdicoccus niigatensis TaxID=359359 RepID=UPI00037985D0|nr:hypothetical protein [Smaragdicoccus niigatensis]
MSNTTVILAHGLGGRTDLPVPLWIALTAGTAAVIISFIFVAALWTEPRLRGAAGGRAIPAAIETILDSPTTRAALRALGLAVFAVMLAESWLGPSASNENPAPTWFYVWFWVGLVFVSVIGGPVYRLANPLRTAGTIVHELIGRPEHAELLAKLRYKPAVLGLLVFLWLELVSPHRDDARVVATFITVYSLVNIAAGAWFGPKWFDRGDGFEVYFSLIARLAPLGRRSDGRLVVRNPLDGLLAGPADKGLTPVVLTVLGSTAFDGITRLGFWSKMDSAAKASELRPWPSILLGTTGLIVTILLIAGLYASTIWAMERFVKPETGSAFDLFVHTLIPIMLGYTIAHYFSFALFQGQAGYRLIWGDSTIDYTVVGTATIAFVQIIGIVAGHIVAVFSAHDQSVSVLRPGFIKFGQIPMMGLMISYTMVGITLVSAG